MAEWIDWGQVDWNANARRHWVALSPSLGGNWTIFSMSTSSPTLQGKQRQLVIQFVYDKGLTLLIDETFDMAKYSRMSGWTIVDAANHKDIDIPISGPFESLEAAKAAYLCMMEVV